MQNLKLERIITIFKTLALWEIVYLALLIIFLNYIVKEIKRIQEHFIWKHSPLKLQHKTLRMDNQNNEFKNVDFFFKLQAYSFCELKGELFHEWKIIPLFLYRKCFRKNL